MTDDGLPTPTANPRHQAPTKERRYCWRVGVALDLAATELCVECGTPGTNHRVVESGLCGHFSPCRESYTIRDMHRQARMPISSGRDLSIKLEALPKEHDGHPCTRPIGHEGRHQNQEASQHCAVVVQAFHERSGND